MAMNEPTWREEVELRFQLENQRVESLFDRLLAEVKDEFRKIDNSFRLLEKDINWLKVIIGAIVLPMILALFGIVIAVLSLAWPHLK